MKKDNMKIVIVGHVDHGKSSLIGRLLYDTGSLPPGKMEEIEKISKDLGKDFEFSFIIDNLKEERDQGITIDTAQIFFHTEKREYVIIDAPGHKAFMKNMMTGASQAETSLLIVDADEGIREQTKRHAFVLSMMNLKKNFVVINKMDLVNYDEERFNTLKTEITDLLKKIDIEPSSIIPISAKNGDNIAKKSEKMNWYTGETVLEKLDSIEKDPEIEGRHLRFPIQDIYNIDDKNIVVGKIESGNLKAGDEVVIVPGDKKTSIKTVEEFGKERDSASAGESIGVTLDDIENIKRGQIICEAGNVAPYSNSIKCSLFWMSPEPFSIDQKLIFRSTTQDVPCKVKTIFERIDSSTLEIIEKEARVLKETEVGDILIETEKPVAIETFADIPELGRFVLEKDNAEIVAGGIITHIN